MTLEAVPQRKIAVMIPLLGEEEAQAAAEAVRSGWVAQGPRVARFEEAFAARVGAGHGVAVRPPQERGHAVVPSIVDNHRDVLGGDELA